MVLCLCRLHNFCLDQSIETSEHAPFLKVDELFNAMNAGLEVDGESEKPPEALMHGGDHRDDVGLNYQRAIEGNRKDWDPREYLICVIKNKGLVRPE